MVLNKDPMADDSCCGAAQSCAPQMQGIYISFDDVIAGKQSKFDDLGMTDVTICALCTRAVTGILVLCSKCGHGGCQNHMNEWFAEFDTCPAGCGCECRAHEK